MINRLVFCFVYICEAQTLLQIFVTVAVEAVARVNHMIYLFVLPEYINHVSQACMSARYLQNHVTLVEAMVGGGMGDEINIIK